MPVGVLVVGVTANLVVFGGSLHRATRAQSQQLGGGCGHGLEVTVGANDAAALVNDHMAPRVRHKPPV